MTVFANCSMVPVLKAPEYVAEDAYTASLPSNSAEQILAIQRIGSFDGILNNAGRGLTDTEIQGILFDWPSGSECSDLESSDDDQAERTASQHCSGTDSSSLSDTNGLDVEESTTVKNKIKKTWHWVKKDLDINEGFPTSILSPRVSAAEAKTPLSMFTKLVDEDLIEHLTFETNRFRVQSNRTRVKPVTLEEMRKLLGMILYMSVVYMPFRRMYWSRLLRQSHIADCMPRNRFDEVISLFHACNNDTEKKKEEDGYDKLYKVRPLLSRLNYNFQGAAKMEDCLAVDEMIVPFKGRHSLKVYMSKKPRKWGYKVWTLAGRSGYVYKIELYGDNLVIDPTDLSNDIGESGKIFVRLSEGCEGKEIFCDNFFASADLLVEMKGRGLGCTATMRNGRIGRCPLKTEKCLKGEGRGSFDFRSEKDSGIIICHWHDNRSAMIGSNTHSVGPVGVCRRYDKKAKTYTEVSRPSLVRVYNQSMGGVDRADQLLSFYRNELKTKKWYKRIIFHLLDLAVVNS
ncbi:hypothetical protein HPB51_017575 [Rhipicephalus microplus]|uniref:PiggyBac transposable element-derived protein domain-containing protein n=1 Tax=Rhipicephalus microplus TaxID=6941 RepID=A0A9J6F4Y4_RHIMP|nr:hypothetical protein HPB51_017575 [Rhipicephalus microplus]